MAPRMVAAIRISLRSYSLSSAVGGSDHPGDGEVALLHQHQLERLPFVSEASWAKKSDAFFGIARSSRKSEFSRRSRNSSARSVSLRPALPASPAVALALKSWTHLPNVDSWMPSSRATTETVRPVLITSFTASSLVLRSEPPTCASHDEYPLLRGVHGTGSRPPMGGCVPSLPQCGLDTDRVTHCERPCAVLAL